MEAIVCDTNILIEILKGNAKTVRQLQDFKGELYLSSISAMELFYGAKDKTEQKKLEKFVSLFTTIHVNESISRRAVELVRRYAKSHRLDIPDSLIAATAMELGCRLFTYNLKDFRFILSKGWN